MFNKVKVIWRKATLLVCERSPVDIFYCIRQVATRVAKLVRLSSQQGWVTLGRNLRRNGLTNVSQILTRSGLSYAIEIDIFCRLSTMHARDTDRRPNSNINRNRRNCLSAMSLKYMHNNFLTINQTES